MAQVDGGRGGRAMRRRRDGGSGGIRAPYQRPARPWCARARRRPVSHVGTPRALAFAGRVTALLAFGIAFGYVEAAVVVYLRGALGLAAEPLFPLREATGEDARLVAIELGREIATLVMLAAIGWAAGASRLERLAWSAVAFGSWDVAYYAWLWLFIGWPPSPGTWDVLFLVPVPWVAPVLVPIIVSAALIVGGIAAAGRLRGGAGIALQRWQVTAGIGGGLLVVGSFMLDARNILAGGMPHDFAWPVFGAGMLLAASAAAAALRGGATTSRERAAIRDPLT